MFVFCNPCARAELHQQKRARKLCSATLMSKIMAVHVYCIFLLAVLYKAATWNDYALGIRVLTHIRRRRRGRRLVKNVFSSFLLWNFEFIWNYPVYVCRRLSVLKTCPCWICYECVQFPKEIRKISCWGSRSPDNAEFGNFTLLFCRGQQRNVPRIKMHVHSHCFAHKPFIWWRSRCRYRRVLRKVLNLQTVSHDYRSHSTGQSTGHCATDE